MRTLRLNVHSDIPIIGFGTWELNRKECYEAVSCALEVGYTHFDTADIYSNHHEVGKAINDSDVPRDKVFLTSKVWRNNLKYAAVKESAYRFLDELDTSYIDLLLIHWPNRSIPLHETLRAFDELKDEGVIRAIGVSNFTVRHLKDALETGVEITNNQVEFHPSLYQKDLKQFCDENGIVLTAYSPIARGKDLQLTSIRDLAYKYSRTPAQIVLKWIISKDIVVIPRSSKKQHIEENIWLFDWELEEEDIQAIDHLHLSNRVLKPLFHEFNYK